MKSKSDRGWVNKRAKELKMTTQSTVQSKKNMDNLQEIKIIYKISSYLISHELGKKSTL